MDRVRKDAMISMQFKKCPASRAKRSYVIAYKFSPQQKLAATSSSLSLTKKKEEIKCRQRSGEKNLEAPVTRGSIFRHTY